jgi:hypothetical protein
MLQPSKLARFVPADIFAYFKVLHHVVGSRLNPLKKHKIVNYTERKDYKISPDLSDMETMIQIRKTKRKLQTILQTLLQA